VLMIVNESGLKLSSMIVNSHHILSSFGPDLYQAERYLGKLSQPSQLSLPFSSNEALKWEKAILMSTHGLQI